MRLQTVRTDPTTTDSRAEYSSVSRSFLLWMRLHVDKEYSIFILIIFTMNIYAETDRVTAMLGVRVGPPPAIHKESIRPA